MTFRDEQRGYLTKKEIRELERQARFRDEVAADVELHQLRLDTLIMTARRRVPFAERMPRKTDGDVRVSEVLTSVPRSPARAVRTAGNNPHTSAVTNDTLAVKMKTRVSGV